MKKTEEMRKEIILRALQIDVGRNDGRELDVSHFNQAIGPICQAMSELLRASDIFAFIIDEGLKKYRKEYNNEKDSKET